MLHAWYGANDRLNTYVPVVFWILARRLLESIIILEIILDQLKSYGMPKMGSVLPNGNKPKGKNWTTPFE